MSKHKIIIAKDGTIRGIYSPVVASLVEPLGQVQIRRASHVEPSHELSQAARTWLYSNDSEAVTPQFAEDDKHVVFQFFANYAMKWWADMLPVNGPVLGPFPDRDTALREEVVWLQANNIPLPVGMLPTPPRKDHVHDVNG